MVISLKDLLLGFQVHESVKKKRRVLRRRRSHMGRRIRALRKLVPYGETMEIGKLFVEAAKYILCLQMQAKAMQVMVRVLSSNGK
ncbi:Transcription factor UPBEAT1 [Dendrobium catenatum]|uniref:Transcription factor UPBEAT1 n=1 Tax=Dendrobium catenatum TaxID=906689 RepID=A0A2I0X4T0_9ASPA|nr:Transcription factor UPBEAT1 [Dendrobium catenatum]